MEGGVQVPDPKWLSYRNPRWRFSIAYPDSFVLLPERERPEPAIPSLACRVSFEDRQLAAAETANLELPQATVDVFQNESQLPLEKWLDIHGPAGFRAPIVAGNLQGTRISLNILLAPNEFVYFGSSTFIYRLTLLGPFAPQIIQSFKFW